MKSATLEAYVREYPGMTAKEIMQATGYTSADIHTHARSLERQGRIFIKTEGKKKTFWPPQERKLTACELYKLGRL